MNQYYQKDLYAILGVSPDCDEAKIKSAYRKQARIWHPDVMTTLKRVLSVLKKLQKHMKSSVTLKKEASMTLLKGLI